MHFIKDSVEVWRSSTPDPYGRDITSKETTDLSTFVHLFNTDGPLEFSLENIVTTANDDAFDAELTLCFYRDT